LFSGSGLGDEEKHCPNSETRGTGRLTCMRCPFAPMKRSRRRQGRMGISSLPAVHTEELERGTLVAVALVDVSGERPYLVTPRTRRFHPCHRLCPHLGWSRTRGTCCRTDQAVFAGQSLPAVPTMAHGFEPMLSRRTRRCSPLSLTSFVDDRQAKVLFGLLFNRFHARGFRFSESFSFAVLHLGDWFWNRTNAKGGGGGGG
jgi:hypothetical protein